MQQPRSGPIKKPHKLEEPCSLLRSKPKLSATYALDHTLFSSPLSRSDKNFLVKAVVDKAILNSKTYERQIESHFPNVCSFCPALDQRLFIHYPKFSFAKQPVES
jgi:hypothetical protein